MYKIIFLQPSNVIIHFVGTKWLLILIILNYKLQNKL